MLRPWTYGPQSLIRTLTDRPFSGLVTFTTEPRGRFVDAAVSLFSLNLSPVAVTWPLKPGPYQEAFTTFTGGAGFTGGVAGATAIGGGLMGGGLY
jgi:hypothetical protein